MMSESDIKIITRSKVCKITENNVEICHEDNSIETIPCAKVVIAAGFKTDDKLINTLDSALGDALVIIGDAKSPRKIYSAVHEGFHAARLI